MGSANKHAFESANNKMGPKRPGVIRQDNSWEGINQGLGWGIKSNGFFHLSFEKWCNSKGNTGGWNRIWAKSINTYLSCWLTFLVLIQKLCWSLERKKKERKMQGLFIQHLRHGWCGVSWKHIIIPNFDSILQGRDFPSKDCVGKESFRRWSVLHKRKWLWLSLRKAHHCSKTGRMPPQLLPAFKERLIWTDTICRACVYESGS